MISWAFLYHKPSTPTATSTGKLSDHVLPHLAYRLCLASLQQQLLAKHVVYPGRHNLLRRPYLPIESMGTTTCTFWQLPCNNRKSLLSLPDHSMHSSDLQESAQNKYSAIARELEVWVHSVLPAEPDFCWQNCVP